MSEYHYEGMFLTHNKEAKRDTQYLLDHVQSLIERAGGRVEQICKWDERKLAYEIKGVTHGIYVLTYFTGDAQTEQRLRGEVRLSQLVLRHLALRRPGPPTRPIETYLEMQARLGGGERRGDGPRPVPAAPQAPALGAQGPQSASATPTATAVADAPEDAPAPETAAATEPETGSEPETTAPRADEPPAGED